MGWADQHIAKLQAGQTAQFRPKGNSMTGKISSGQLVTVVPVGEQQLEVGMIVLCRVKGNQYLHLISAIANGRIQISNNKNFVNGWTSPASIYGIVTMVED